MRARIDERSSDWREVDRWSGGVGWMPHPEEAMRRASHALATDAGVYVVDPIDVPGLDDLLADLGRVVGVVVLTNWHRRDAAAVARRHDVPVYVPSPLSGVAAAVDAPVERFEDRLPGSEFDVVRVTSLPGWREAALYDGETLVAADTLGTAPSFTVGDERLGVWTFRRLAPPRSLAALSPRRVLVGHGEGVHEDAAAALTDAVTNARRRAPRAVLSNGPRTVRTALAALR